MDAVNTNQSFQISVTGNRRPRQTPRLILTGITIRSTAPDMRTTTRLLSFLGLCVLASLLAGSAGDRNFLTTSDCVQRGFYPSGLSCSNCRLLSVAAGPSVASDCAQCCRNDELVRYSPFSSAKLIASKQSSGGVGEFLEKHASKFKGLQLEDSFVPEPKLILQKSLADGSSARTMKVELSVGAFKTEHIEELLKTHLRAEESS